MSSDGRKVVQCVQEKYLDQITDFQPRAASESSDHDCGIALQSETAEVAETITRNCVFLLDDLKTRLVNDIASAISKERVRDWCVGVRS